MSENRYTMMACEEATGISRHTIRYRAKALRMDTKKGLSAAELKRVVDFPEGFVRRRNANALREELGALK